MIRNIALSLVFAMALPGLALCHAGDRYQEIYIPNSLARAEQGDWVIFRMSDGTTQKHIIANRSGEGTAAKVTVRVENYAGDRLTTVRNDVQTVGETFVKPPVPEGKTHFFERRTETIDFDGSQLEVDIVEVYETGELVRTWVLSTEIPVYGVVRRVAGDDAVEFETIDFGYEDDVPAARDPVPVAVPAASTPAPAPAPKPAAPENPGVFQEFTDEAFEEFAK